MTTDEKVELALSIAHTLQNLWEQKILKTKRHPSPKDLAIGRGEWQRWAIYYQKKLDLHQAIRLAKHMGNSPAVRSNPQRAAQTIFETMQRFQQKLERLYPSDLAEIFGYVGRFLEYLSWQIQQEKRKERGEA